jgi:hypothetical protein
MSQHQIQLATMKTNELGVTLFLPPPPPCPPPKSTLAKLFPRFRRRKAYVPQLETINEVSEDPLKGEWITLYEYIPVDWKRRAMYVVSDESYGSIRLHV